MENIYDFNDWLDGSGAFNYGTPQIPTGSPGGGIAAERAGPAPDQTSGGEHALPLLRLGAWRSDQKYNKNNPICIHYDFRWKVSHRENIRARHVCSDTDPDLVLAPSDFWIINLQAWLDSLLKDEDKSSYVICRASNAVVLPWIASVGSPRTLFRMAIRAIASIARQSFHSCLAVLSAFYQASIVDKSSGLG
jgi:hypothetical protein